MTSKAYSLVSGIVFGIMSILHAVRMLNGIEVYINLQLIPVGASLPACLFFGFMSAWAFTNFVKALHSQS